MILTGSCPSLLQTLVQALHTQFAMKDIGVLSYFLGIQAIFHDSGLFLHPSKYTEEILTIAGMQNCNRMPTPLPLQLDKVTHGVEPFSDPTYFCSLVGKLQYLTLTRPDIQFAVNFVCQRMHSQLSLISPFSSVFLDIFVGLVLLILT